jgi:predicted RNA-binding protein
MCLSAVYIKEKADDNLVLEEVSRVSVDGGTVTVGSIFGEQKELTECRIAEVNLSDNYIILKNLKE